MALVVILGIFIAIDYLGTMDEFIAAKISLWRAFFFVLLQDPLCGGSTHAGYAAAVHTDHLRPDEQEQRVD